MAAGPVWTMATLLPTKSPAPMTPPIAIIAMWREPRLLLKPAEAAAEGSTEFFIWKGRGVALGLEEGGEPTSFPGAAQRRRHSSG